MIMKKFKKVTLSVAFLFVSLVGFSEAISFYTTGQQSYYDCCVPSGTFNLQISPYDQSHTYTWTGGGNDPQYGQYAMNLPYPNQTTIYTCVDFYNGESHYYYFTITVYTSQMFTVSGYYCCSSTGTITLSGSDMNVIKYRLYKNGTNESCYMGASYDKTPTGSALYWYNMTAGTYTVKALYAYTPCLKLMYMYGYVGHICCKSADAINDNETSNSEVKIFPNPSNGNITIETNSIGDYVLVNDVGQEVKQFKITTGNTTIEIKGLKTGVYFLKNVNGSTLQVSKINVME
jgi:hypothetical protein